MEADKKTPSEIAKKNIEPISFFSDDVVFSFVFKKTEKLASALYIITGLFLESEPMKIILRKKASDFLSFIISYKDSTETVDHGFVYNAHTKILELVSLMEIAMRGGLISDMNFSILKQEFLVLNESLASFGTNSKDPFHSGLSKSFFGDEKLPKNIKDNEGNFASSSHLSLPSNPELRSHQATDERSTNSPSLPKETAFKKSNRQTVILNLIKKRKELTIKDISEVIRDCSEKTIQRELISLIAQGVVKRKGERRWSKYSLV